MRTDSPRGWPLAALLAFCGALAVAACVVPHGARSSSQGVPPPVAPGSGSRASASGPWVVARTGPWLDHAAHAQRGLSCGDCHGKGVPAGGEPRPPTYAACAECHDDEDKALPDERKVRNAFFAPDGSPRWSRSIAPYDGEVLFSHGAHATTACETCHETAPGGGLAGPGRVRGHLFSMDTCVACHDAKRAKNSCDACHRVLREDVAPADHAHLWKQRHGLFTRTATDRRERHCDDCHRQPQWCEKCHRDEAPANHTNLFRLKTHGVLAAMDRASCQVCHTTDYCQRCHLDTPPRSHRGMFAHGKSTHCLDCHFPIRQEENCHVCHREEPRHETAPDMPPWHEASFVCRNCHNEIGQGGAPPLRHVDNGMSCLFCHH
jgi:hypothetical protein